MFIPIRLFGSPILPIPINEPMTNMYFSSPSYDNYPVVGITWKQANAFCIWRTNYLN